METIQRERENQKKNQVEVEVEKKREKLKIFTLSLFFLSLHPFCSPPLPAATAPQCRLPCRRPPCAPCAPPRPRGECLARRDTEEKAAAWEEAAASKSKQREQSSTLALALRPHPLPNSPSPLCFPPFNCASTKAAALPAPVREALANAGKMVAVVGAATMLQVRRKTNVCARSSFRARCRRRFLRRAARQKRQHLLASSSWYQGPLRCSLAGRIGRSTTVAERLGDPRGQKGTRGTTRGGGRKKANGFFSLFSA